jgi:hypothetical protein
MSRNHLDDRERIGEVRYPHRRHDPATDLSGIATL